MYRSSDMSLPHLSVVENVRKLSASFLHECSAFLCTPILDSNHSSAVCQQCTVRRLFNIYKLQFSQHHSRDEILVTNCYEDHVRMSSLDSMVWWGKKVATTYLNPCNTFL